MDVSRMSHAGPPHPEAARRRVVSRSLSAALGEFGFAGALNGQLETGRAAAPAQAARQAPAQALLTAVRAGIPPETNQAANVSAPVDPSGAPRIVLNPAPPADGGDYVGPASLNPYFGTPSHPLEPGNVKGFENWFQTIQVGQPGELGSYAWTPPYSATEEGAQEALRIVSQFMPGGKIRPFNYPGQLPGQPPSHVIEMPNGKWINAGLLLDAYYTQGRGVTALSDLWVQQEVQA